MKIILKILSFAMAVGLAVSVCAACQPSPPPDTSADDRLTGVSRLNGEALVDENIHIVKWEGRYEYARQDAENGLVMLYHTATGFTVEFVGTKLTATFRHSASDIYYDVAVDGETLPNTAGRRFCLYNTDAGTDEEKTLVEGLDYGLHSLTCLKMDEPADALTGVSAIATDGEFCVRDEAADDARLKFMFVCASGGSGFGSLSFSAKPNEARTRKNSSSLHAFNYLTARMYDADVQFVAQAGWGVLFPANKTRSIYNVLDYCGITPENDVENAQKTGLWNYGRWIPDVIIFNIGGNDTSAGNLGGNDVNDKLYCDTVVGMVLKLHAKYPSAKMIWTHTESTCGRLAVSGLNAAGVMAQGYLKEVIIPSVGCDGTLAKNAEFGYGAANHNSLKTHIVTADILSRALEDNFGMSPVRQNVAFEDFASVLEMH